MRTTIHADCFEFKHIYDIDQLKQYNGYAVSYIKRMNEAIEGIRKYQMELFNHVQTVLQTDFEKVVTICRRNEYVNSNKTKIFYYVRLEHRPMVEPTTERLTFKYELDKKFSGTERNLALKYAKELSTANYCRIEKIGRWN